ncbi:hypothetical protein ACJJTC_015987 [Scirpophaga incertulas]
MPVIKVWSVNRETKKAITISDFAVPEIIAKEKNINYVIRRTSKPSDCDYYNADLITLDRLFRYLGFDVTPCVDYDRQDILDYVKKLSMQDHRATSCLAIVILTHGANGGKLCAGDQTYNLSEIMSILTQSPNLTNKPKLLFVQACRGGKTDEGKIFTEYDGNDDWRLIVPTHADYLITYSSPEDYVAFSNITGSWMIQEICKTIKENHKELDLLHMITLANEAIAQRISCSDRQDYNQKKQIMETWFTLTKLLKF